MIVACVALVVATSGLAWAAIRIDTEQLRPGAVTAKKLHRDAVAARHITAGAVTDDKLRNGAVGTDALSAHASGVALAGVQAAENGNVGSWFNRLGGKPDVLHNGVGRYSIQIPGSDDIEYATAIHQATLRADLAGEISAGSHIPSSGPTISTVTTRDSAGNPADRSFFYLVYEGGAPTSP